MDKYKKKIFIIVSIVVFIASCSENKKSTSNVGNNNLLETKASIEETDNKIVPVESDEKFVAPYYEDQYFENLFVDHPHTQLAKGEDFVRERLQLFHHEDRYFSPMKPKDLRKGIELEVTKHLVCTDDKKLDTKKFYGLIRGLPGEDYKNFFVLQECKECESFSTTFPIDEIPWDEKSHKIRMSLPYLWLSIEKKRFGVGINGKRSLKSGDNPDLMDDYYFDTDDFVAYKNDFSVRGRRRWQSWNPYESADIQRLLVAIKEGTGVDLETGIKSSRKVDDRTREGKQPTIEDAVDLVNDVRSGSAYWVKRGNKEKRERAPLESIAYLYEKLKSKGVLKNSREYKNVMALKPKSFVRSMRGRYHLIETPIDRVDEYYQMREMFLTELRDSLEKVGLKLTGYLKEKTDKVRKYIRNTIKGKTIEKKFSELLKKNKLATDDVQASNYQGIESENMKNEDISFAERKLELDYNKYYIDALELVTKKIIKASEAIYTAKLKYGVSELSDTSFVDLFRYWQSSFAVGNAMGINRKTDLSTLKQTYKLLTKDKKTKKRTTKKFKEFVKDLSLLEPKEDESNEDIIRFNLLAKDIVSKKNFKARMKKLSATIKYNYFKILLRKLETSVVAAKSKWFEMARNLYVPKARRVDESLHDADHLYIDTFDFATIYSANAWSHVTPDDENNQREPLLGELWGVEVVNEVQIELRQEGVYLGRIKEIKERIKKTTDVSELKDLKILLAGAEFVFDQYKNAMEVIANIKGENLTKKLKGLSGSLCENWSWENAEDSKGNIAMKMAMKNEELENEGN